MIRWVCLARKKVIIKVKKHKLFYQLITVLLLLTALMSGVWVHAKQKKMLMKSLDVHVATTKTKIFRDITDQFESLLRMSSRWEAADSKTEAAWRHDAQSYVNDIEGMDMLMYVNTDHVIQWMESKAPYEFFEGKDLTAYQDFSIRMNQAIASNHLEISKPVQSNNGDHVVYMVKTAMQNQQVGGFIVARVNTFDFLNKVLVTPGDTGFHTMVTVDDKVIYHNGVETEISEISKVFEINLDSDPEGIFFTIYPTKEILNAFLDAMPIILWVGGFLVSMLFYWAMISRLKAKLRSAELATEVKQKRFIQKKLEHMAHYDALTNLPNRYLLSLHLDKHIAQKDPMWLLYMDLDLFKDVNDTLGHGVGDQLLIELSRRFEKVLQPNDFIARMGGDEFVLVLEGRQAADDVIKQVNKMLQVIAQPFYFDEELVRIGASIGLAHFPVHCDTASQLITHADTALRYVKNNGRHNYKFYDVDLAKSSQDRLLLLDKINNGIKNNEFELVYQPRVDTKTGKFWGAEALIRWSQKDGSLLTPKVFLQILEESGLIISVGWQVLDSALARFKELLKYNPELKLSYNVSAKQLESPDFVTDLLALLLKHQFPTRFFELELTEQTLISDLAYSKEILHQLKSSGITIAIDDFGTGYSSLAYLKNFPVDVIKIDKSFVKDIATQKDDYELIKAIISMGKNLNLKVVAEGVESQDQLNILKRLGCDEAQGYYFNKPATYDVFKEIVAAAMVF